MYFMNIHCNFNLEFRAICSFKEVFFCLLILKQMINIFRLFVWQPWIRLLSKTITINDKVIDEKYSKSTFLKKNFSVTSSFFPWLTNGLKHLSFKIKKNTNRTEPFFVPILMQTTAFTWSFFGTPWGYRRYEWACQWWHMKLHVMKS